MVNTNIGKWIESLEWDVDHYDKVILFQDKELLRKFCGLQSVCPCRQKLLILSSWQIPLEQIQSEHASVEVENLTFRRLREEEIKNIRDLYFTYEFSDNFILVSAENKSFADLYHFVKTGIITTEEMFGILLYKRAEV